MSHDTFRSYGIYPLLLALLSLLFVFPSLNFDFIGMDDKTVIQDNERLRLEGPDDLFRLFEPDPKPGLIEYMPLKDLSLAIDVTLFGPSPTLLRFQTMFWYMMCSLAVYLFFGSLIEAMSRIESHRFSLSTIRTAAFVMALLFVVHPVHVNSWAWLSSRKDLLAGFFVFFSLFSYLRYRLGGRGEWLAVSLATLALGLLSKPTSLFVPIFVLSTELSFLKRPIMRRRLDGPDWMRAATVTFVYAVPASAFAVFYHFVVTSDSSPGAEIGSLNGPLLWITQLANYLKMSVWPIGLQTEQLYRFADALSWTTAAYALIALSLGIATIVAYRKDRGVFLGIALFVAPLTPMMISSPFGQYWTTRYLFFSIAGLIFIPSWLLMHSGIDKKIITVASCLLIVISSAIAQPYAQCFSDNERFWTCHVEHDPSHWKAYQKLAFMSLERGDYLEAAKIAAKCEANDRKAFHCSKIRAIAEFEQGEKHHVAAIELMESIATKDTSGEVFRNLALMYARTGHKKEALESYKRGMEGQMVYVHQIIDYAKFLWSMGERDKALKNLALAAKIRKSYDPDPQALIRVYEGEIEKGGIATPP